ncbi:MAG TPA: ribosome biogenesis GTP-binding protein YihA/YsxC [Gammaproteobacteria bacterium]|nr:ribosome biogenesis GTP-binding protein YihA/YsxC [Gammaproteobacteria bacterium]
MNKLNYQKAVFLLSIANLSQLPPDEGIEVAIVGRSNSGKSSVLNQLTQNKGLARVSKTPGRTQLINLFALDQNHRLADLPGYGYAKVPPSVKKNWQALLDGYLRSRECLRGLILVMDIRHPLKEFDRLMLEWCHQCDLSVHILLNKCDKMTQSAASKTLREVKKALTKYTNEMSVQIFSAMKGKGVKELRGQMDNWFME